MTAASLVENRHGQKAARRQGPEDKLPDHLAFEDRHVGRENRGHFLGGGRENAGDFWQWVFLSDAAKMFIYAALYRFHIVYLLTCKELCNSTGQA